MPDVALQPLDVQHPFVGVSLKARQMLRVDEAKSKGIYLRWKRMLLS